MLSWSACQHSQPAASLVARLPHSCWQQHNIHSSSGARFHVGRLQALRLEASRSAPRALSSACPRRTPLQQDQRRSKAHEQTATQRCSMCHCTKDFALPRTARRPLCSRIVSAGRCPDPTHSRTPFRCASSSVLAHSFSHASGGGGTGWHGGFGGGGGGSSGVAAALAAVQAHDTSARVEVLLLDVGGALICINAYIELLCRRLTKTVHALPGMKCGGCVSRVQRLLEQEPDVQKVCLHAPTVACVGLWSWVCFMSSSQWLP